MRSAGCCDRRSAPRAHGVAGVRGVAGAHSGAVPLTGRDAVAIAARITAGITTGVPASITTGVPAASGAATRPARSAGAAPATGPAPATSAATSAPGERRTCRQHDYECERDYPKYCHLRPPR
jgi:hypothetical protein